jgi:phospholipid/cholesterol/gamma-HCH transport system ATP-binding protein
MARQPEIAAAPPGKGGMPAPDFIQATGLVKRLGGQTVLNGASLGLHPGETLTVLGRSGEGKSVLLKILAGLMTPDAGSVRIDGEEIVGIDERQLGPVRRKFGLLFQNGALFDSLNVEENVAFPLVEFGVAGVEEVKRRVRTALEAVGMSEHWRKMPVHLSGGQRKRVALARAIITQPRCLLYDEPTAGLDPIGTANIDRLIRDFQERFQVTSLVITHDLKTVERIATRVAFLRGGRIHFLGTPKEFFGSNDTVLRQFLDGRPDDHNGT